MLSLNKDATPLIHLTSSNMRRDDEDKEIWMPIHLKIISSFIDELPPDPGFESQDAV
jgi:hypothetical protein